MNLSPFLAAAVPGAQAGFPAVDFQTALLLVIVVCLAFMAKALADLNRRVDELAAQKSAPPAARAATASAQRAARDGAPSPEILAVITAAVYAVIDQPARIVAVDEVTAEQARHWSMEGRRQIFTSHRVR